MRKCEEERGQDGGRRRGGILEWGKGTDGGIDAFRLCLKKGLECEKKRGKVREKRRGKSCERKKAGKEFIIFQ